MEWFMLINVLLAAYGGWWLHIGVFMRQGLRGSRPLGPEVLSAALCGWGAALVLLPLLAVHVMRAARAMPATLYACGMLLLMATEAAVGCWLASQNYLPKLVPNAQTSAEAWAMLALLLLLGTLQLAGLALAVRRACCARPRPRLATSATAWKPM